MIDLILIAQLAQPVPKLGRCPLGYYTQFGYCVPAAGSQQAVQKAGPACPYGWYSQGSYCARAR